MEGAALVKWRDKVCMCLGIMVVRGVPIFTPSSGCGGTEGMGMGMMWRD